jgi:HD superfamily phosphodiesterase
MIPANEKAFTDLAVPALLEYQFFGKQVKKLGYEIETSPFSVHGIKHILRVLLLSLMYYHSSGEQFTSVDRDIMVYFALLHDVGRTNEGIDDNHGRASVEKIRASNLRIRGINLTAKEYRIAHLIIECHCIDDDDGIAMIQTQPGLIKKDKDRAIWLYRICKDMDGLDRVRFNGLDYRMLRTEFARRLPLIAGCLLSEDMLGALDR